MQTSSDRILFTPEELNSELLCQLLVRNMVNRKIVKTKDSIVIEKNPLVAIKISMAKVDNVWIIREVPIDADNILYSKVFLFILFLCGFLPYFIVTIFRFWSSTEISNEFRDILCKYFDNVCEDNKGNYYIGFNK